MPVEGPVMGAPDDTPQTWAYIEAIGKLEAERDALRHELLAALSVHADEGCTSCAQHLAELEPS